MKKRHLTDPSCGISLICCIVYSMFVFAQCACAQSPGTAPAAEESEHQRLTREAWDKLKAKKYSEAISTADECIQQFRHTAERIQSELKATKEPEPPRVVEDEALKRKIFSWGPLNDVAACYFIKGEASEKLAKNSDNSKATGNHKAEAKKAYEEVAKFTYARIWDLGGWFWKPAEEAEDRLADMKPSRP